MYHCLHFNDGHFFFVDVPAPIMSIRFDPTSRFILTSGDKYVRVFHNVPGYKVAIGKLNLKLREASNQTLKERIQNQIKEAQFMVDMLNQREL